MNGYEMFIKSATIVLLIAFVFFFFVMIGFTEGKEKIRNEAVANKVAYYSATSNGCVEFSWMTSTNKVEVK